MILFSKLTTISDEYKYSIIQIKWLWNIIRICICAISRKKYIHIFVWHQNIFGYLFCTLCGIQIYSDILSVPFYDICSLPASEVLFFFRRYRACIYSCFLKYFFMSFKPIYFAFLSI